MVTNPAPKNSNNTIKYIAIGFSGLALIGGAYQLLRGFKKKKQKDLILKTLTMIRRDLFPIANRMKIISNNSVG